ncbi:RlmE family RNA methyltransferase [Candidatus Woesearchaeota archaeon]|nr:RlmE family RNA methyltransferase [Candidatus Woesearchaeota archaeon]
MDPFSKKARAEGYRARSIYKLKYLNKKYKLIKQHDSVLDIGSFPGSWLQACKDFRAEFILGIDIKPIKNMPGVRFIQADIENDKIFEKIKAIKNSFDVIISDVAPKTTGNLDKEKSLDLTKRAYEIAKVFLKPDGNFLAKIFQGGGVEDFVREIKNDFEFVKLTKPLASKKRSYEIYIVTKGFKIEK